MAHQDNLPALEQPPPTVVSLTEAGSVPAFVSSSKPDGPVHTDSDARWRDLERAWSLRREEGEWRLVAPLPTSIEKTGGSWR